MPVENLPNILEDMLNTLLQYNHVHTWQMKGGEDYTQVSMRFKIAEPGDINTNIQYRRKSRIQMQRHADRIKQWSRSNHMKSNYENTDDTPIVQAGSSYTNTGYQKGLLADIYYL